MSSSTPMRLKVDRLSRLTPEVLAVRLIDPAGQALPAIRPGDHLVLHLGGGLDRHYSVCNGPDETDHYLIAVKLEPESRGGSKYVHGSLNEGDIVVASGPANNFRMIDSASSCVLLAAGIGVTPILSMVRHLDAANTPFEMHYFTRSEELTAFHHELKSSRFASQVRFAFGLAPEAVANRLDDILRARASGAYLYICGPGPFIEQARRSAATACWPAEAVRVEYFSGNLDDTRLSNEAFEVNLLESGQTFTVPADKSILDVLKENGIAIDSSCCEGVCGTCVVGVVSGEIDHRDVFLSPEERADGKMMTVCVSRAKSSSITIEL